MTTFELFNLLPPYIDIILVPTKEVFEGCTPRLTLIGSKFKLSYGVGNMDCPLYSGMETEAELMYAFLHWSRELKHLPQLAVDVVFVNGDQYPEP